MTKKIISVIDPGEEASFDNIEDAYYVGEIIAQNNAVLINGGRNKGIMQAVSKGAKESAGLVVGILPTENDSNTSEYVDIPIYTGMGSARNNIIALSSHVIIAIGIGLGTSSEIVLALKAGKK